MATRRPIVQINGELQELPMGDSVAGAGAGGTPEIYVQPNNPGLPNGTPAIWIQTGLGSDGAGFTFWFND